MPKLPSPLYEVGQELNLLNAENPNSVTCVVQAKVKEIFTFVTKYTKPTKNNWSRAHNCEYYMYNVEASIGEETESYFIGQKELRKRVVEVNPEPMFLIDTEFLHMTHDKPYKILSAWSQSLDIGEGLHEDTDFYIADAEVSHKDDDGKEITQRYPRCFIENNRIHEIAGEMLTKVNEPS